MFVRLRKYFISGLLIWLPVVATVFVLRFLLGVVNNLYHSVPDKFHVNHLLGLNIPGLGIIITLLVIILTGVFAANFFGKKIMSIADKLVGKIPLVRTVYLGIKQILETMFNSEGKAFRKVLLVEYPRKGLWSVAFQTGSGSPEVNSYIIDKTEAQKSSGSSSSAKTGLVASEEVVTIFVPTTPNPTSGFLIMAPKRDIIELNISVDQALKFVISLGVVQPGSAGKIKQDIETAVSNKPINN